MVLIRRAGGRLIHPASPLLLKQVPVRSSFTEAQLRRLRAESAPAARLFSSGRVEVSVVGFSPRLFGVGCGRLRRLNNGRADSRIGDLSESSQETDTLLLGGEVVVVVEIIARGLLSEVP